MAENLSKDYAEYFIKNNVEKEVTNDQLKSTISTKKSF